jgi:UDP-3-O-[3-hydroxymyristoyl] N-acetylglucosamine deacetylase
VLNPEGLRRPDEFVRHKALDAIGDLYVLGAPILGRFEGELAGHGINNALVRALEARPDAWRIRTFADEIDVAV